MNLLALARILRKTFLTRSGERHYSQYGEDAVLLSWFSKKKQDNFFVDVGCYHPTKGSNTYALYRRGWRGINIDLDPDKISAFKLRRPGDVNLVAAVSDNREALTVYSDKWFSMRATLDPAIGQSSAFREGVQVETITLSEIIDATRYRNRTIDLLSVDVEGLDLRVLKGLDFSRYAPRVILVETHLKTIESILAGELHRFLDMRGYELANWVGLTLFYRMKN